MNYSVEKTVNVDVSVDDAFGVMGTAAPCHQLLMMRKMAQAITDTPISQIVDVCEFSGVEEASAMFADFQRMSAKIGEAIDASRGGE